MHPRVRLNPSRLMDPTRCQVGKLLNYSVTQPKFEAALIISGLTTINPEVSHQNKGSLARNCAPVFYLSLIVRDLCVKFQRRLNSVDSESASKRARDQLFFTPPNRVMFGE